MYQIFYKKQFQQVSADATYQVSLMMVNSMNPI